MKPDLQEASETSQHCIILPQFRRCENHKGQKKITKSLVNERNDIRVRNLAKNNAVVPLLNQMVVNANIYIMHA